MAELPCKKCQHYDPIQKGSADTRRGWCAVKSVYPYKEQHGQSFPRDVQRAEPGALAKPFIVIGAEVQKHCAIFRGKP